MSITAVAFRTAFESNLDNAVKGTREPKVEGTYKPAIMTALGEVLTVEILDASNFAALQTLFKNKIDVLVAAAHSAHLAGTKATKYHGHHAKAEDTFWLGKDRISGTMAKQAKDAFAAAKPK